MNNQTSEIAKALYTVNRHAKTAPEPQHLYYIKKETINRLLREKKANKMGLHFSNHPKLSNQHSTLLVKVANYYFHILPTKKDFEELKHLGELDDHYRNERARMSLSYAKRIIYNYIEWQPNKKTRRKLKRRQNTSSYFTPSSLGQWPSKKTHR